MQVVKAGGARSREGALSRSWAVALQAWLCRAALGLGMPSSTREHGLSENMRQKQPPEQCPTAGFGENSFQTPKHQFNPDTASKHQHCQHY